MAGIRSNRAEVVGAIRAIAASWDLRAPGMTKRLGDEALDRVSEGIYDRTVLGQQTADGAPLAPLAESTLRRKAKLGFPETIGVETGLMLAMEQLQGERTIERRSASVVYGTDERAKVEAEWFQDPSRPNQPPRPFFELDDRIEAELDDLFESVLEKNIRDLGG